ncbi:MAG: hypothetical protein FWF33_02830 [Clostridiales bacterium]|nr:hypothetical protein [Clostridiales bacterium]
MRLRILWMFPDILNLHGGRGDVMALLRICEQVGVEAELRRVDRLTDDIDFAWANLVVFGPGELAVFPAVRGSVLRFGDEINNYVNDKKAIFAVGTTGALLATETERTDGSRVQGLGLIDMTCRECTAPFGDDLIFRVPGLEEEICGIQIRMLDFFLAEKTSALGEASYGVGNTRIPPVVSEARPGFSASERVTKIENPVLFEGAVEKGVVFTNALGPVLVKNPWFALWLIRRALEAAEPEQASALPDPNELAQSALWENELESSRAVHLFNETKVKLDG